MNQQQHAPLPDAVDDLRQEGQRRGINSMGIFHN